MKAENTGVFKLYKKRTGQNGLFDLITGTEEQVDDYFLKNRAVEETDGFTIFKQEQVIYKDTHIDKNGKSSDSEPTWRNVPIKIIKK